jgi:hypothetical protein
MTLAERRKKCYFISEMVHLISISVVIFIAIDIAQSASANQRFVRYSAQLCKQAIHTRKKNVSAHTFRETWQDQNDWRVWVMLFFWHTR